MQKKWLWLLVLPVLLCGAVVWVQNARWSRVDARFRQTLRREYVTPGAPGIEVRVGRGWSGKRLGFLSRSEAEALAEHLHLRKWDSSLADEPGPWRLQFEGKRIGFSIPLDDSSNGDNDSIWISNGGQIYGHTPGADLDLTPNSYRALRREMKARWGREIAVIQRQAHGKSDELPNHQNSSRSRARGSD